LKKQENITPQNKYKKLSNMKVSILMTSFKKFG
jgi:hypothetical protein